MRVCWSRPRDDGVARESGISRISWYLDVMGPLHHRFHALPWVVRAGGAALAAFALYGLVFAAFPTLLDVLDPPIALVAPLTLLVAILALPVLNLLITPICEATGVYRYHGPLFLTFRAGKRTVELHAGTLWDYLWTFSPADLGRPLRRAVLIAYLDGLIAVADRVADGTFAPDTTFVGTSYFFGTRSVERLGFTTGPPNLFYRVFLRMSVVELSVLHSLAIGRPSIAPVWRIQRAAITGAELVARRDRLVALRGRLERTGRAVSG